MKRFAAVFALAALAFPLPAGAFHHGSIPASACASSPTASNNATARTAINERNPVKDAGRTFPPFGTPGESQGQGGAHCANAQP